VLWYGTVFGTARRKTPRFCSLSWQRLLDADGDELETHYARALSELDEHDLSMLAAWHGSLDVGQPVPSRDFLMGAFPSLGVNRREALKLAAGFRGEEAVDAGVTEERALETVVEWLSPPRLMELAAEAVDLYIWDRAGGDN